MTKSQLVDMVAQRSGLPHKVIEIAVGTVFESMVSALEREERIEIRGFGNFTIREYRSYVGRNPKTGDRVSVPPKRMPFFKVGKDLRNRVNSDES